MSMDRLRIRARLGRCWPALLLLGLACLFCWPVFLGRIMTPADTLLLMPPWRDYQRVFDFRQTQNEMLDPIQQYLPWRHFAVDALRAGLVPLWNPFSYCGTPFLANLQSTVLYPPNLLFLVTGAGRGFGISYILHLFLAGLFMFGFLRALKLGQLPALLGAVVFMFNGFTVAWLEYPTLSLWTTAWLPLLLWLHELAVQRRSWRLSLACGAIVGLQFLGGHLQMSAYILLAFACYVLVRGLSGRVFWRSVLCASVSLIMGLALSAAQLLPTLELARNSLRATASPEQALATALPLTHLIIYLLPDFFGSPAHHNYWGNLDKFPINYFETAGYVGIPTLFLAVCALSGRVRKRWAAFAFPASYFLAILLLAALVALGTPLYYLFCFAFPGFAQFRGLARILFLAAFGLAGLAALGLENLMQRKGDAANRPYPALAFAAALLLLAGAATALFSQIITGLPEQLDFLSFLGRQWIIFAVLVLLFALLLVLRGRGRLSAPAFGGLALTVLVGDLLTFGLGFNPAVDPRLDFLPTKPTDFLRQNLGHDRMTSIGPTPLRWMPANTPLAYRLRDIHGSDSLVPRNYERFLLDASGGEQFRWPQPGDPFLQAAGVRYLVTMLDIAHPDWELALNSGDTKVYRNRRAVSRASLSPAGRVSFVEDEPNRVVLSADVVPPPEGLPGAAPKGSEPLAGQASGGSRLTLADTAYPGWRVNVDGKLARPLPAAPVFRAVKVKAGRHRVEWRYDPTSFRAGLFLSLLAWSLLASAAVGARHR